MSNEPLLWFCQECGNDRYRTDERFRTVDEVPEDEMPKELYCVECEEPTPHKV